MKKSNLRYIIVGTHKTMPEQCGWYVSIEYKKIFWEHLNDNFNTNLNYSSTVNTFRKEKGYGYINDMPNILFFDLIKFDEADTSKDAELFDKPTTRKIFFQGAHNLVSLIESCDVETRVGLIGANTSGIFYNAIKKSANDFCKIESLKRVKYKSDYGLITNPDFIKLPKTSFYLLENITSRYYKAKGGEFNGWKNFYTAK